MASKTTATQELLYAWEGIACIAVMMAHCPLPGKQGPFVWALMRFAIPLFFAVSGKFFALRRQQGLSVRPLAQKRVIRSLKVLTYVTAVYTGYSFIWFMARGENLQGWLAMKYAPKEWVRLLFFNTGAVLSDGSLAFDHLWFISALLTIYVVIYLIGGIILQHAGKLCVLLFPIYFLGLRYRNRLHLTVGYISTDDWYILRNWALPGLLFFLLGVCLAKKHWGNRGFLLALAGIGMTAAEYALQGPSDIYIGSCMTVIGALTGGGAAEKLLVGAKAAGGAGLLQRGGRLLSYTGKALSRHVYYWHMLIYSILIWLFWLFPGNLHTKPMAIWLLPLATYILTIVLAIIVVKWRKRWIA